VKLEKEDSTLEKEDFKKNSRINKLLEENSDLQKRLTKYKEDGGSVVNALILVRLCGRWGKNDWKKSSNVTYDNGDNR
jgi:hypothetical protein